MPQSSKLAIILAVTLAACGGKDDEDTSAKDGGSGHDASGGHDASSSSDAGGGGSSDAGGGSSDAGSGSSDAGGGANDASSGADSGNKAITSIAGGSVSSLDGGVNAKGAALLVRTGSGALVSLQVSGLMPSKMYPAHVHDKPCDAGAGGHYLLDKSAEAGVATNEIWPALATDDAGQGRSFVDVKVAVRDDAVAVVVHDPDNGNAKMLCADLVAKSPYTTTGTMPKVLGGAADAGVPTITASASITRGADGSTAATISASNLKPDTEYMVHVHDQPCDFASGGGHYKFDYGIGDASASNEIWLNFKSDTSGAGMKTATISGHTARAEAQAIVIHAMDGTRLACIDLK